MCPGKSVLPCLGIFGVLALGWVSQGRLPDLGQGKPESPFTAAADLEYHPLTSRDKKLKLNSQGPGPRAQRSQNRGWGVGGMEDLRLPLCPLQQQKPLRQMGGKNP